MCNNKKEEKIEESEKIFLHVNTIQSQKDKQKIVHKK
jgi:hypothetical protein